MSMLKVAGINENEQPMSFKVDNAGRLQVVHQWQSEEIFIFNQTQIRDTANNWSSRIDVSKFATISLRIGNTHNQPITCVFARDTGAVNTTYLKNYGGSNLGFTIPANSDMRLITPEEFPFLQYLQNIRIGAKCSNAPESGYLTIILVGRY